MRGLNPFKGYTKTLALYQQAEANVAANRDAAADKIAVQQIATLQKLAKATPPPVVQAAAPVAAQESDYPTSYYVGLAGIAGVGLLALWLAVRK